MHDPRAPQRPKRLPHSVQNACLTASKTPASQLDSPQQLACARIASLQSPMWGTPLRPCNNALAAQPHWRALALAVSISRIDGCVCWDQDVRIPPRLGSSSPGARGGRAKCSKQLTTSNQRSASAAKPLRLASDASSTLSPACPALQSFYRVVSELVPCAFAPHGGAPFQFGRMHACGAGCFPAGALRGCRPPPPSACTGVLCGRPAGRT